MGRRKRKNSKVRIPRDREDRLMRDVLDDTTHMYELVSDLEGSQELKDELAEGIGELEDLIQALLNTTRLPSKGLKYPWDNKILN